MIIRLLTAAALVAFAVGYAVGWLLIRNQRFRRRLVMAAPHPYVAALAQALDEQTNYQPANFQADAEPSAFDKLAGVDGYQRPGYERDIPPQRPDGYTGRHRGTGQSLPVAAAAPVVHEGATVGWSPMQDQADSSDATLTPTGLLEFEPPAALDDGTVIGARNLPAWDALQTDTHHALDAAWEAMLAEFRANMDAIIAALDPETVAAP